MRNQARHQATHHARKPGPNRAQGLLWAAFANAAVLTALIVPVHIAVQGVLAPLGLVPSFDQRYATFAPAVANWLVKIYLLVLVVASLYVFGHRIRYVLMELAVPGSKLVFGVVTLGLAALGTAFAAYVLLNVP
jgi:fumarate reductase subunit D